MAVYRSKSSSNFTHLKNEVLQDGKLSVESLGLLVYLLSMPEDWVIRNIQIQSHFKIGRDKRKRIMAELVKAGYLIRRMKRNQDGSYLEADYMVFDEPQDLSTENPPTDYQSPENHTTTKNLENNKGLNNKKHTSKSDFDTCVDENDDVPAEPEKLEDWEQAYEDYQLLADSTDIPKARKLTAKRKSQLKQRIKEEGLETWRNALRIVYKSDFLKGKNDSGWCANLDFLLSPNNLNKVLEGKYDNRNSVPKTVLSGAI